MHATVHVYSEFAGNHSGELLLVVVGLLGHRLERGRGQNEITGQMLLLACFERRMKSNVAWKIRVHRKMEEISKQGK